MSRVFARRARLPSRAKSRTACMLGLYPMNPVGGLCSLSLRCARMTALVCKEGHTLEAGDHAAAHGDVAHAQDGRLAMSICQKREGVAKAAQRTLRIGRAKCLLQHPAPPLPSTCPCRAEHLRLRPGRCREYRVPSLVKACRT